MLEGIEYRTRRVGDATLDPAVVHDLLASIPELAPRPDTLGNIQAVFRLDRDADSLVATVPVEVTDEALDAALAGYDAALAAAVAAVAARDLAFRNETTLRERADQAVAALEKAYTDWPTLTTAQRMDAARLNIRVTAALVRLTLRKLDEA